MAKPEFRCNKCHLDLVDDASVRKHLEESPIHIYCAECDQEFANEVQLKSHIHTYQCPNCLLYFLSTNALESHQKSAKCPNLATPHECTVCALVFPTATSLNGHMRSRRHRRRSEPPKKTDTSYTKSPSPDDTSLGPENNVEVPNQGDLNDPQVGASRQNIGTEPDKSDLPERLPEESPRPMEMPSKPDEDIEEVFQYIPDTSFESTPHVPHITVSLKDYLPTIDNEESLQKVLLEQSEALRALQKQFKTFQAASEERERIWATRFERLAESYFERFDNFNERISKQLEEMQAKLDKLNDEKDALRYSQPLINLLD